MKNILLQAITLHPEERFQFLANEQLDLWSLVEVMGDKDSELRDSLAFRIFVEALFSNVLPPNLLEELLDTLTSDDFLFYKIGEDGEESVYKRSFSALWISYLLKYDRTQSVFSKEQLAPIFSLLSTYLIKERDGRGFVEEEGWANAFAHASEMYTASIRHPFFEMKDVPKILQGISSTLWSGYVFVDDEEVKFAEFIQGLHTIDYPEEVIVEWIEQIFDRLEHYLLSEGYTRTYFKAKTNSIHLMQSIYFKCKFSKVYPKVASVASYFIAKNHSA